MKKLILAGLLAAVSLGAVALTKAETEKSEHKCAIESMFHRMVAAQKIEHTSPNEVLEMDPGSLFTNIPIQEKKKIINFIYFGNQIGNMNLDQISVTAYGICMTNERNFQPLK